MSLSKAHAGDGGTPLLHLGLLLAIQVLWGANWVFAKIALTEIPPLALMTLRFLVLFTIFVPFMRWHKGQMGDIAIAALTTGALSFGTGFVALTLAHDIAPLAVASNLGVPFATILSALFLGDRVGAWRGAALLISFAGVLVIGFDPRVASYLGGFALNTIAAFFWAVGAIYMRKTKGVSPLDMQGWVAIGAWPPLLAVSYLSEPGAIAAVGKASATAWGCLAFLIVGSSLIGHVGFNWLLQRHPIPVLAPFMLLAAVIASVLGIVFLGDEISWRVVVGGAMTLAGVLVITIREGRRRRR